MPDAETSSELDQMEAKAPSAGVPMNLPDLPRGAALRRPGFGIVDRYHFWLMQRQAHHVAPQMHLMPAHYICAPRMRRGLMRSHMHLMGEPREPSVNFQGGRGLGLPRGMQCRGMHRKDMVPLQGIKPQRRSREPENKSPRGKKNEGVEPKETEKKVELPGNQNSMGSPGKKPQVIALGGLEPLKDDQRP